MGNAVTYMNKVTFWVTNFEHSIIFREDSYSKSGLKQRQKFLPDSMEYLISAFLSWSLSIACTCTIDVPTAAVSNTRPSNEDDRNSGLKRKTQESNAISRQI